MNVRSCTLLAIWLLVLPASTALADDEAAFTALFDGRTFDGWEGNRDVFRIDGGAIVGGTLAAPVVRNEFLCTRKEFGDFELRLKARLKGPGDNAGVQFRSRRIRNHHEVIGYQCDMGTGAEGSIWGALYDESRRRRTLAAKDPKQLVSVVKTGEWNDLRIRCQGHHIQIWVNGVQTVNYVEKEPGIETRGMIGLQIHGGAPAEASYKDIRIRELTAERP